MDINPLKKAIAASVPYVPSELESLKIDLTCGTEFLKSEPPQRKYLLAGVLPLGEVGMIVGQGGIGKSMFTNQLTLAVTSGNDVCGGVFETSSSGSVLMINAEDGNDELHRRFHQLAFECQESSLNTDTTYESKPTAVHQAFSKMHFLSLKGASATLVDAQGNTKPLYYAIRDEATDIPNLNLIIVDPLRRFFDGNEDASDTASRLIPLMEDLASETGATVLLVHHISKASSKYNSLDQFAARGSAAFTDLVRWQMNIAVPSNLDGTGINKGEKHQHLEVFISKNNYGVPQSGRKFLKRCEGGILKYVHTCGPHDKLGHDINLVVGLIKSELKAKNVYSKTELKNQKEKFNITLGDKALIDAISTAIQKGLLIEVPRPNHSGKGKVPKDLIPKETSHPGINSS